jgi:hypothetical protein
MGYDIDIAKFNAALEQPHMPHELFNDALSKGWKPDFQEVIKSWHIACLVRKLGEGYVEHILKEHSTDDIIWRLASLLIFEAEEFLTELEEEPTHYTTEVQNVQAQILELLKCFGPNVQAHILQELLDTSQKEIVK